MSWELLQQVWPFIATGFDLAISLAAATHVVLYKRNTRAAIGWMGIIWLAPILGTLLYVCFGVNRIRRRAQSIWRHKQRNHPAAHVVGPSRESIAATIGADAAHLLPLVDLIEDVAQHPLLAGNRIRPLFNGEEAYTAMLAAIENAEESITLCTYIFDNDRAGEMFVRALRGAVERGVQVRVLIDGVGKRYSFPSVVGKLRKAGVRVATFLPTLRPWFLPYMNLRNHRKILVVDGRLGFTGGMNIREGHLLELKTRHSVQDLHFELEGPIVAHLQGAFAIDWEFSTEEKLSGAPWFGEHPPVGTALARGIADGPDDDFDRLQMVLLGAIGCARRSITVMTPYFLPDESLISALNVAAMRGVAVDIVLPAENNLRLVKWAATAQLWQILECGCRVWMSPPPFSHSKLVIVDSAWLMFGSANWDPRSLRLNFEFNVECYDKSLALSLTEFAEQTMRASHPISLEEVDSRPFLIRVRDGVARLAAPYL